WIRRSAEDSDSACASVFATTKSTPSRPASIMLLTALPPAPPTPKTVIRGLSSCVWGTVSLMLMSASWERIGIPGSGLPHIVVVAAVLHPVCRAAPQAARVRVQRMSFRALRAASEVLLQPAPEPADMPARLSRFAFIACSRRFHRRDLRISQKTGACGEGRTARRIRKTGNPERMPDAHLLVEHARGKF